MLAPLTNLQFQRQQAASYSCAWQWQPQHNARNAASALFTPLVSDLESGLGFDRLEFSPDLKENLQCVRALFAVNIEVVRALVGQNEETQINFSVQAIYEFIAAPGAEVAAGQAKADAENALSTWLEYFSPEKTAERILDFALSYFPRSKWFAENGDTADARQDFADYIRPAIQKGFDEARRILGVLPENIQEHIAKTHKVVFQGIQDFVEKGLDPAKNSENGLYNQIEKYRARILAEAGNKAQTVLALYNERGQSNVKMPASALETLV